MIVDFSALDLNARQAYILKNLDGTTIQPLLNVIDPHAKLSFNEVSELTFTVPSKIDGVATPHYADIVGMRIIDWDGVGQFILNNPKRTNDGIIELKQCTAYSLEYELGYKRVYIEEGTYNLAEVLDMIFENVPSWSRGTLSPDALLRYRTFGGETYNVYDLLKGTLQELYSCVFEFDTYERLIHVIDGNDIVDQRPILISLNNLAKEIVVEENTEELFTCFSVSGADDVDISSVNPLGKNLIYNLDYFMNTNYFSQDFIDKWNNWKDTVETNQQAFYMLTVDESLELVRRTTEEAKLLALRAEHSNLKTEQSAYTSTNTATETNAEYQNLVRRTKAKEEEIAQQEELIASLQETIDDIFQQKEEIVATCELNAFFTTKEDQLLLDKYIRTSDFNEPSFVYREYTTYETEDMSNNASDVRIDISEATITHITDSSGKEFYRIVPGVSATSDSSGTITALIREADMRTVLVAADIKSCVLEKKTDSSMVFTAELGAGTYSVTNPDNTHEETEFTSGCLSLLSDRFSLLDSDLELDEEVNAQYETGTTLAVLTSAATVYFTQGVTEYSKRSVEWELYEFAMAELEKAAWPKYQFTVDSANFLSAKEFEVFRKQFTLGARIYLDLDGGLTPIAIGAEVDLDDPTSLSLTFGDEYSALESSFQIVDLLSQSVSMGKSYQANKGAYGNFISSGSKDALYNFINAPLDVAKNAIMSSSDQAIQFDSAGFRLRRYADESKTTYDPEQIWMCHNSIVFTDNNWTSATMAIGKFKDPYLGEQYGICAPAIMGTILAGNKLWIRSATEHGGVAEFQVDGDGARLYNAKFDLYKEDALGNSGVISLNPELGIVGGVATLGAPLFATSEDGSVYGIRTESGDVLTQIKDGDANYIDPDDLPNANFWVDMNGNVYFKGTVYATNGRFDGVVQATQFLDAKGNNMFGKDKNGNIWIKSDYLDLSELDTFINETYKNSLEDIAAQLDKKAETWHRSSDPSVNWTTDEVRDTHVGDLWFNTIEQKNYMYDSSYTWVEVDGVPDEVYDKIDGKAAIYTSKPSSQNKGDLLIPTSTFSVSTGTDSYRRFGQGKIFKCTKTNASFDVTYWEEVAYTDDTKADSAYSLADAAKAQGQLLVDKLGFQQTEITGEYVISPVIAGGCLLIGEETGVHAKIDTDGTLTCKGAIIEGTIKATAGTIGGCSIEDGTLMVDSVNITNGAIKWANCADDLQSAIKNAGEDVPDYIQGTYIDFRKVETPLLIANEVKTLGMLQVGYVDNYDADKDVSPSKFGNFTGVGFIGEATGSVWAQNPDTQIWGYQQTHGVAMSNTSQLSESDNYVIVTTAGTRIQGFDNNVYVAKDVVGIKVGSAEYKFTESGFSGFASGDVETVAVFG